MAQKFPNSRLFRSRIYHSDPDVENFRMENSAKIESIKMWTANYVKSERLFKAGPPSDETVAAVIKTVGDKLDAEWFSPAPHPKNDAFKSFVIDQVYFELFLCINEPFRTFFTRPQGRPLVRCRHLCCTVQTLRYSIFLKLAHFIHFV